MIRPLNQGLESRLGSRFNLAAKELLGRYAAESRLIMRTLSFVVHDPKPK